MGSPSSPRSDEHSEVLFTLPFFYPHLCFKTPLRFQVDGILHLPPFSDNLIGDAQHTSQEDEVEGALIYLEELDIKVESGMKVVIISKKEDTKKVFVIGKEEGQVAKASKKSREEKLQAKFRKSRLISDVLAKSDKAFKIMHKVVDLDNEDTRIARLLELEKAQSLLAPLIEYLEKEIADADTNDDSASEGDDCASDAVLPEPATKTAGFVCQCGEHVEDYGHNGAPLFNARVCDACNTLVMQERVRLILDGLSNSEA